VDMLLYCNDSEAPLDDMEEWARYTSGNFHIKEFDANHFFPFNCEEFDDYYGKMIVKADKNQL